MVTIIVDGTIYHEKKYFFKKLLKEMGIKYTVSLGIDNPIWQSPIVKITAHFEREGDVTVKGAFTIEPDISEHAKRIVSFLIEEMGGYSDKEFEVQERIDKYKLFKTFHYPNEDALMIEKAPAIFIQKEFEKWELKKKMKLEELGLTEEMLNGHLPDVLPVPIPIKEGIEEGYVHKKKKERRNLDAEEFKEETRKFNEARNSIRDAILSSKKGNGGKKIKSVEGGEEIIPIIKVIKGEKVPPLVFPERDIDPPLNKMKEILPNPPKPKKLKLRRHKR